MGISISKSTLLPSPIAAESQDWYSRENNEALTTFNDPISEKINNSHTPEEIRYVQIIIK